MSVLEALENLSSAEEFFEFLGVPYDAQIVRVARLHIMRRMGQYLRDRDAQGLFDGVDDRTLFALCRENLEQAYADFVASSPIAERVFKVHQEAIAPEAPVQRPFVPLSALTGSE